MRAIVNISLPPDMLAMIKAEMKNKHFASMSEFFRQLVRTHYEDKEALGLIKKSKQELAAGKGKVLRSLRDLS